MKDEEIEKLFVRGIEALEHIAGLVGAHLVEARARNEMLSITVEQGRKGGLVNDAMLDAYKSTAVIRAATNASGVFLFTYNQVDPTDPNNPNFALTEDTEKAYDADEPDVRAHAFRVATRLAQATGKHVEVFRHDFASILFTVPAP